MCTQDEQKMTKKAEESSLLTSFSCTNHELYHSREEHSERIEYSCREMQYLAWSFQDPDCEHSRAVALLLCIAESFSLPPEHAKTFVLARHSTLDDL